MDVWFHFHHSYRNTNHLLSIYPGLHKDGVVFSGSGDGFRQMMPFQLYLYEHFTQLKGFYDHSFGLGGDYVKGLAYYYSFTNHVGQFYYCMDR